MKYKHICILFAKIRLTFNRNTTKFLLMNSIRICILLLFLCGFKILHASDFHISNYNYADAYLNPSLPSQIEEDIRINMKYRGQWETVANAYSTFVGQVDFNPLNASNRFCEKKLVLTPQIIHDRAGELGMSKYVLEKPSILQINRLLFPKNGGGISVMAILPIFNTPNILLKDKTRTIPSLYM